MNRKCIHTFAVAVYLQNQENTSANEKLKVKKTKKRSTSKFFAPCVTNDKKDISFIGAKKTNPEFPVKWRSTRRKKCEKAEQF